jgi:hypothetical protein
MTTFVGCQVALQQLLIAGDICLMNLDVQTFHLAFLQKYELNARLKSNVPPFKEKAWLRRSRA